MIVRALIILLALLVAACASEPQRPELKNLDLAAKNNVELGIAYMNKGQLDVALGKLKKALEQSPGLASAHNAIAILYARLGENELADRHYKEALEIDSDDPKAHNNYGLFLCDQKRYAEAEAHFMKAVANPLYRTPWLAYNNAGVCMNRAGNRAGAEQSFRKALKLNPLYPPALIEMAHISYRNRNFLAARGYIQRLQSATRHNPETLWLAIETEQQLRNHDAVSRYGRKLVTEFPDSAEARKYRAMEARSGIRR